LRAALLRSAAVAPAGSGGSSGSTGPATPVPLDPAGLAGIVASTHPGLAVEIIDLFLRDTPKRVASVPPAALARAPAGLKRTSHSLRGSAGMIGAVGMVQLCSRLEALAEEGALEAAAGVADQLLTEHEAVRAALTAERERLAPAAPAPEA